MRLITGIIAALFISSCGGQSLEYSSNVPTQMPPYIGSVVPASASPGDTVVVFGFGYSLEDATNVVSFGNYSTSAADYGLVPSPTPDDIEMLTVTVPAGATAGVVPLYVTVYNNTSNSVDFTINP